MYGTHARSAYSVSQRTPHFSDMDFPRYIVHRLLYQIQGYVYLCTSYLVLCTSNLVFAWAVQRYPQPRCYFKLVWSSTLQDIETLTRTHQSLHMYIVHMYEVHSTYLPNLRELVHAPTMYSYIVLCTRIQYAHVLCTYVHSRRYIVPRIR